MCSARTTNSADVSARRGGSPASAATSWSRSQQATIALRGVPLVDRASTWASASVAHRLGQPVREHVEVHLLAAARARATGAASPSRRTRNTSTHTASSSAVAMTFPSQDRSICCWTSRVMLARRGAGRDLGGRRSGWAAGAKT